MLRNLTKIFIVVCGFLTCSFRLPDPYTYSLMDKKLRGEVLLNTWENKTKIIESIMSERDLEYAEASEEFFEVYYQMLLVDNCED